MSGAGIPPTVKIGVAGWSYEDWKERVYPRGLKAGDRLAYLAQYFDCIEINSTFYANPRAEVVRRWAELAAARAGFLFTCKVNRTLTHEGRDLHGEARAFRAATEPLAASGRLGAVLAQFPWFFRFTPENFDRLRRLADLMAGLPLVFELRHRSFLADTCLSFLAERGIGLAALDLPASRSSLPEGAYLFGPVGYFRFHGRNRTAWFDPKAGRDQKYDYLYGEDELSDWVPRIRAVAARAEVVFCIANNHYRGQAPANALDLAYLLGENRAAPEPLLRAYPHLRQR
jgi:uncharacterized protein YecE (DUF72 family)